AVASAAEAGNLHDLGARVLPDLKRAARAQEALLYRYDDDGRLVPIAGAITTLIEHYARHYVHDDPVQTMPRKLAPRPRVVLATRRVDGRAFRRSAAYGEFYRAFDLERLACVWLTRQRYATPGMTGILFTRPRAAPDFDGDDSRLLGRALPALVAAAARADRLRDLEQQRQALEALVAAGSGPARLVLSGSGGLGWASAPADG